MHNFKVNYIPANPDERLVNLTRQIPTAATHIAYGQPCDVQPHVAVKDQQTAGCVLVINI